MSDPGKASLGVLVPQNTYNPIPMVEGFADIQNKINTNRLFQQTFAARQKAGQIINSAADTEAALKALQSDPETSAFAPEIANSIRQYQLATTQISGELQKQAQSGFEAALKLVGPMIMAEPGSWGKVSSAALGTLSPQVRERVAPMLQAFGEALTDDLPTDDPVAARAALQRRFAGMSIATGITPELLSNLTGSPTTRDVGGQILSGVQAPAWAGGGFAQGAGAVEKTPAPQVVQGPFGEGGATVPLVIGGGGGAPRGPAAGGNALMPRGAGMPAPGGARAGGPSGPSMTAQQEFSQVGQKAGQIQEDMIKNAEIIPSAIKRLDTMTNALSEFQAGGGAEARVSLAKALQALKNAGFKSITDETIQNVANDSLPASQLFMKYVKPVVTQEMQQNATASSTRIKSEVDAFLSMMDATTDPKALMQMLNNTRYNYQLGYDQSRKWPEFKRAVQSGKLKDYDLADFYSWYNEQLEPKGLPSTTPGGINLAAEPLEKAKGVGGGSATHRYVPGKGIVPITPPSAGKK